MLTSFPKRSLRTPILGILVLAFAACSGGGGGGSGSDGIGGSGGPVPLKTQADVVREAGNFVNLAYQQFNVDPYSSPGTKPVARRKSDVPITDPRGTFTCRLGGGYTEEEFTGTRTFRFFPQTLAMNYGREIDNACKENAAYLGAGYTITYDGFYESGSSAPDETGTTYTYTLSGQDGVPGTTTVEGPGYLARETETGLREYYLNGLGGDFRYQMTTAFDYPGAQDGSLTLGSGTTPFVFFYFSSGPIYAFNGPLRYSASGCAGGDLTLLTTQGVTFGENNFEAYVSGGALSITSGTGTVDLVFQLDGSVVYQIRGGLGGTLTRAEVLAGGCDFVSPQTG